MPNQPRPDNRVHAVRIEDGLWDAAKALAARLRVPVSQVVRTALQRYVDDESKGT